LSAPRAKALCGLALALLTVAPLVALQSREGNRTADGGAACPPAQPRRKPHWYVVSAPPDVSSAAWVNLGITTGLRRGSRVGCAICRDFGTLSVRFARWMLMW